MSSAQDYWAQQDAQHKNSDESSSPCANGKCRSAPALPTSERIRVIDLRPPKGQTLWAMFQASSDLFERLSIYEPLALEQPILDVAVPPPRRG